MPAKLEYFENEDHNSIPIITFHNGFSAIFEGNGISYFDKTDIEQLNLHIHALSEQLSWYFRQPEYLVYQLGYCMLQNGNNMVKFTALEFFILNVDNCPNSPNSYNSLGEAFETLGDTPKAIENY